MSVHNNLLNNCAMLVLYNEILNSNTPLPNEVDLREKIEEYWSDIAVEYYKGTDHSLVETQSFEAARNKASAYFLKHYNVDLTTPTNPEKRAIASLSDRAEQGNIIFYAAPISPAKEAQRISTLTHDQKVLEMQKRSKEEGCIAFYEDNVDPLTGVFGNFHQCPIKIEFGGKHFSNSEAIFQAQKMQYAGQTQVYSRFDVQTSGDQAVQLGRTPMNQEQIVAWDGQKIEVMMNCLRAKFGQNPQLKELLLATGDSYLMEHLPDAHRRDKFWSDAYDGNGAAPNGIDQMGGNHLGICLMRLRQEYGGAGVVTRPAHDTQKLEKFYDYSNTMSSSQGTNHGGVCKFPGCNKSVYSEFNSQLGRLDVFDFCGRTHANAYKQRTRS